MIHPIGSAPSPQTALQTLAIKPNKVIGDAARDLRLGKFLGAVRNGNSIEFCYEKGMIGVSGGKISTYWLTPQGDTEETDRVEMSAAIVNLARAHHAGAFQFVDVAMGGARGFAFEKGTVSATDNWAIADANGWKRGPKHFTVEGYIPN